MRYSSSRSQNDLQRQLYDQVEPQTGRFRLVSKLSGGGVVIRGIEAPRTEQPWFGQIDTDHFRIALTPGPGRHTPFQPILHGRWRVEGDQTHLEIDLAPHPSARIFAGIFALGGVLLGMASLLILLQAPPMALVGLALSALFFTFPGMRARAGFAVATQQALDALEQQLGLEPPVPDPETGDD